MGFEPTWASAQRHLKPPLIPFSNGRQSCQHRIGNAATAEREVMSHVTPYRALRPPRHQVSVVAWQLGHSRRRFSRRSSCRSPLTWSTSSVMARPRHSGGVPHSAQSSGTPTSRSARRSRAVLVRCGPSCLTRMSAAALTGVGPGLPRWWAWPRKWAVLDPSSWIHCRSRARDRLFSGRPSDRRTLGHRSSDLVRRGPGARPAAGARNVGDIDAVVIEALEQVAAEIAVGACSDEGDDLPDGLAVLRGFRQEFPCVAERLAHDRRPLPRPR